MPRGHPPFLRLVGGRDFPDHADTGTAPCVNFSISRARPKPGVRLPLMSLDTYPIEIPSDSAASPREIERLERKSPNSMLSYLTHCQKTFKPKFDNVALAGTCPLGKSGEVQYRIAPLREAKGLSQEKLAEKIGKSVSYVSRLERGERRLHTDLMEEISGILDCQPCDLIEGPHLLMEYELKLLRKVRSMNRATRDLFIQTVLSLAPEAKPAGHRKSQRAQRR